MVISIIPTIISFIEDFQISNVRDKNLSDLTDMSK